MFLWAFAAEAGIVARQARELGLSIPIYGGAGIATPLFPQAAGAAATGVVAAYVVPKIPDSSNRPATAAYRDALLKRYNGSLPPGRPNEYDMGGYTALKLFADALARCGANPTREALVAALEHTKDYDSGVAFPISYTPMQHEGTDQTALIHVGDDAKWHIIGAGH